MCGIALDFISLQSHRNFSQKPLPSPEKRIFAGTCCRFSSYYRDPSESRKNQRENSVGTKGAVVPLVRTMKPKAKKQGSVAWTLNVDEATLQRRRVACTTLPPWSGWVASHDPPIRSLFHRSGFGSGSTRNREDGGEAELTFGFEFLRFNPLLVDLLVRSRLFGRRFALCVPTVPERVGSLARPPHPLPHLHDLDLSVDSATRSLKSSDPSDWHKATMGEVVRRVISLTDCLF